MQEALGTGLNFSTAFHLQTDGQSERVIQILEDMLKSCVIDYEGSWDRHIPLIEFVYNNSFKSSIGMAPYEALYGRKCRTPLCLTELSEKKVIGPDLIQETEEKVKMIRERLKVANDRHKSYADMKRKDIRYEIGEKVFLKVSDECKTHLCFEFISHAILCILYPYSCKTHKISSKLGFVGLLMKSK